MSALSRPRLSPSELRCSPHTTYYTNLFVVRTAVTINGQPAEIGFSDNGELSLYCRYPSTECMRLSYHTVSSQVEAILKKHRVSHVSNFWVGEAPFFQVINDTALHCSKVSVCVFVTVLSQVGFSSEHSLRAFLGSQQEVQREVGSLLSARLREGEPSTASPVRQELSVEVETQVFLVLPESEDKVRVVSEDNCGSCLSLWKESEKFEFGCLFRSWRVSVGGASVKSKGRDSVVKCNCDK